MLLLLLSIFLFKCWLFILLKYNLIDKWVVYKFISIYYNTTLFKIYSFYRIDCDLELLYYLFSTLSLSVTNLTIRHKLVTVSILFKTISISDETWTVFTEAKGHRQFTTWVSKTIKTKTKKKKLPTDGRHDCHEYKQDW